VAEQVADELQEFRLWGKAEENLTRSRKNENRFFEKVARLGTKPELAAGTPGGVAVLHFIRLRSRTRNAAPSLDLCGNSGTVLSNGCGTLQRVASIFDVPFMRAWNGASFDAKQ
jgi:hypothetical protein